MKSSTEDKAQGKLENLKGKIKEVAGVISGKPDLEREGREQRVAGKVREKVGEVKKVFGK